VLVESHAGGIYTFKSEQCGGFVRACAHLHTQLRRGGKPYEADGGGGPGSGRGVHLGAHGAARWLLAEEDREDTRRIAGGARLLRQTRAGAGRGSDVTAGASVHGAGGRSLAEPG